MIILIFTGLLSCQSIEKIDQEVIFLESPMNSRLQFLDLFVPKDSFHLNFGDYSNKIIPDVAKIRFNKEGEIFILNRGKIHKFTNSGRFIIDFGEMGKGPGEALFLVDFNIDKNGNVWTYDLGQRRLTLFSFDGKDYNYDRAIELDKTIHKFCMVDTFLYGFSNLNEHLLTSYNLEGEMIRESFKIDDTPLRIFLGRFNGGGLCLSANEKYLYSIFPGEYSIYKFDKDLDLISEMKSGSPESIPFRPKVPPLPLSFDPYDYTEKQKDWYYSFDHCGEIFSMVPNLLLLEMYREKTEADPYFYVNIYTENGDIIGENLALPKNSRMVGTYKNQLYLASEESLNEDGSIEPVKIYIFELAPNIRH